MVRTKLLSHISFFLCIFGDERRLESQNSDCHSTHAVSLLSKRRRAARTSRRNYRRRCSELDGDMATIVESAPGSVFVDYSRGDGAQRAPSHRILRKNRAFAAQREPAPPASAAPPAPAPGARPWMLYFCWPDDEAARASCWSVCAEDEPDAPSSLDIMEYEPDEPDSEDEEDEDARGGGAKRGDARDAWATRARTDADSSLGEGRRSPTAVHQQSEDGAPNSGRGG